MELLIVLAIVGILAALAVAGYRMTRVRAAEAGAISALQAVNHAQFAYAQTCGNQRFAPTLAGLGTPHPSTGTAFLSPDLAVDPAVKSGYQIVMEATTPTDDAQSCIGLPLATSYKVTAEPTVAGVSGLRYFGTNTDRVIYADTVSYAEDMPEAGAPPHGAEIR